MPETLSREDPDFDLRLVQPTAVSGRVVDGEPPKPRLPFPRQRHPPTLSGGGSTKWIVSASGYAIAKVTATRANSKPERSGVAKVKWRPAFGSRHRKD